MSSNLSGGVRERPADPTFSNHHPCVYRFGSIEVDFSVGVLRKAGLRIHMQDQPLQVLSILVRHPGVVVSREEFRRRLWPADTFVDFDHGLNSAMKRLRDALNDDADRPRFIETIPRHGYRFIAPITESPAASLSLGGTPAGAWTLPVAPELTFTALATENTLPPGDTRPRAQDPSAGKRNFIILAICVLILGAAATAAYRLRHEPTRSKVVVTVLPFRDLTPASSQHFLAEAITQELITDLNKLNPSRMAVSARASSSSVAEHTKSSSEIGGDGVGTQLVLEGSTRLQGDHLRVTVQLMDVTSQRYVWTESYDETVGDLLQQEAAIAAEISAAVRQKVVP